MIVLLGCLSLILFPPLLKQINKAKTSISETTKTLIIDAAKDYYEDNKKDFKKVDGVSYCINVNTIVEQNYLNGKLKDKDLNDINTNKEVKLTYLNNKFNYELVDSCTYYTVTFDASGGNVDIETKQVLENSLYGDLPTPTKEGYTFMGWNGKNLVNLEKYLHEDEIYQITESSITIIKTDSNKRYRGPGISLEDGKKYTASAHVDGEFSGRIYAFFGYSFRGYPPTFIKNQGGTDKNLLAIYQNNDNSVINIQLISDKVVLTNIQLEEGETATEYEPYYVNENIKVTRNYDHTLKAIWKENKVIVLNDKR